METKVVDIAEVRDRLSELIDLAQAGTEVIIATGEHQVIRLVPVNGSTRKRRIAGLNRGQIWMSDDFDAPLPDTLWLGEE